MLRRFALPTVQRFTSVRWFTPTAELAKLYNSKFDSEAFPVDIVASDSTLFAKFLFKAAEPKKEFDAILKDFDAVANASKKLPIFWERNANLDEVAEFKSLNAATQFTMHWMQANQMLDNFGEVRNVFETYVNASKKRVVARIYTNAGEKNTADIAEAKAAAQLLHKESGAAGTIDFVVVADPQIIKGYALEVSGKFASTASGVETESKGVDIDYTNIPLPKLSKTVWPENIEADILRKYIDQLSLLDAEEQRLGV